MRPPNLDKARKCIATAADPSTTPAERLTAARFALRLMGDGELPQSVIGPEDRARLGVALSLLDLQGEQLKKLESRLTRSRRSTFALAAALILLAVFAA